MVVASALPAVLMPAPIMGQSVWCPSCLRLHSRALVLAEVVTSHCWSLKNPLCRIFSLLWEADQRGVLAVWCALMAASAVKCCRRGARWPQSWSLHVPLWLAPVLPLGFLARLSLNSLCSGITPALKRLLREKELRGTCSTFFIIENSSGGDHRYLLVSKGHRPKIIQDLLLFFFMQIECVS